MKKRGRPSEQRRKETCEGRVWNIVTKLRRDGDYGKTIREIANLSGHSTGAVSKTSGWQEYLRKKKEKEKGSRRQRASVGRTRRRRSVDSVEGRVWQIVKDARSDYSLTVRQIAEMIGCSKAAVGKTEAWRGYVITRERDKAETQNRRRKRAN